MVKHGDEIYNKKVERVEYMVLPETQEQIRYFWLNVDSTVYEWSFSIIKVGKGQIYSNLNFDGKKRKNPKCFNDIKIGDFVLAYETGNVRAITTLCKVVDKYKEDDEIFVEFQKIEDYEKVLKLESLKEEKQLGDCDAVRFHRGTIYEIEKRHFDLMVQMLDELNPTLDIHEELYHEVKLAIYDGEKIRSIRLENRTTVYPEAYVLETKAYKRNKDVIAEVLVRASGICEKCNKEAPFNRKSDGTPYLEVHHIKRLADGGEDTVENAIAVCPNCHRELHYG